MERQRWHHWKALNPAERLREIAGGLFSVALMTLLLILLRPLAPVTVLTLLYLLPVLFSVTRWGLSGGIISSVGAFLTLNFFFIQPYYTLLVHQPFDVVTLFVFLLVAVVTSQLVARARASEASARAREQEVMNLYQLNAALGSSRDQQEIGAILQDHLLGALPLSSVEVWVGAEAPSASPAAVSEIIPLRVGGRQVGLIRLRWREAPRPQEQRLLAAFITQGAQALERLNLSQAESRAKVLEESDRLKSALLSSVSHELRTPLATIKAAATGLQGSEADSDLLAALNEEVDRMNQVIENLLNMSRLEAGSLRLLRQWNLLDEVIEGTLRHMRRATIHHPVRLDLPEDLPLISVDQVLMEQVFINLISNSVKYAPSGTPIDICARVDAPWLRIELSNQGPPLAEEDLPQLFERFFRAPNARQVPGVGLGLSICKGIVEAHGGHIHAENHTNGLSFCIRLPLIPEGVAPPRLRLEDSN